MILKVVDNSDKTECKKIIDTVLNHEGLLISIVQWGFWEEEYRPDITKELTTDDCVSMVRLANETLYGLAEILDDREDKKNQMRSIGSTSIVSKDYDPTCTIPCVVGLIRRMKTTTGIETTLSGTCIYRLIFAECVDRDVITQIISFGLNTSMDFDTVEFVSNLLIAITRKETKKIGSYHPSDSFVACAVRNGLIEMFLGFIGQFGMHEYFPKERDERSSLCSAIDCTLLGVYEISMHQKSWKAIRNKRTDIEEKLAAVEQSPKITSNANCKKLLDMVRSTLDMNGSYCCRCNKSLTRTEVKLCNGCGCMSYCSKACQKKDWINGHSQSCGKTYTNETVGHFQGRVLPRRTLEDERDASKLKELEINVNMIQLKIFKDNSEIILSQADTLGIPLNDCVVEFDLRKCPPAVETQRYTEYFKPDEVKGYEDSRSESIMCIYRSYIIRNGVADGNGEAPSLFIQRLFPHEQLVKNES